MVAGQDTKVLYNVGNVVIRTAIQDDCRALAELEQFMNPAFRVGAAAIEKRININTEGTLILALNDTVVGVLFTVQIDESSKDEAGDEFSYTSIYNLHNKHAKVAYWIHLIVHPDSRHLINTFHSNALAFFFNTRGCDKIRALTHCSSFSQQSISGEKEEDAADSVLHYVEDSLKVDRNLFFHSSRGARLLGVMPAYNDKDVSNLSCCVIMEYLPSRPSDFPHPGPRVSVPAGFGKEKIIELVAKALQEPRSDSTDSEDSESYSAFSDGDLDLDCPWFQLGLDSMSLMVLHKELEEACGMSLDVSFLFAVNTTRKLINFFAEQKELKQATSTSKSAGQRSDLSLAVYGIGLRFPAPVDSDHDIETCQELWAQLCQDKKRKTLRKTLVNRNRFDVTAFPKLITMEQARCIPFMQRVALETCTAALADTPQQVLDSVGRRVGVFVGAWEPCASPEAFHDLSGELSVHAAAGVSNAIIANRISYLFDFVGPSMVIDTACSSSLVALDAAQQAIATGKCDAALVVGVNVVDEATNSILKRANFLSPSGACHTFDAKADGYARAEGCGAVFLSRAIDGAPSRASILTTAINQDGRTANLHAPSPESQAMLLHAACDEAGISPESVAFVECHGTGTKLGDPIECFALNQVLGDFPSRNAAPLLLTSSKAKFGHMESAAGMLGLVATVLALQQRMVPGNGHLRKLNESIPFHEYGIKPAGAKSVPLPAEIDTIYAGVSSFGFGGTNAHTLLANSTESRPLDQLVEIDWPSRCINIPFSLSLDKSSASGLSETVNLDQNANAFLSHHRVGSLAVVPGTFLVVSASRFFRSLTQCPKHLSLENIMFDAFVPLPTPEIHISLEDMARQVVVRTASGNSAAKMLVRQLSSNELVWDSMEQVVRQCSVQLPEALYPTLRNKYRGPFHCTTDVSLNVSGDQAVAKITIDSTFQGNHSQGLGLETAALLDGATHACFALLPDGFRRKPIYLNSISSLRLAAGFEHVTSAVCHVRLEDPAVPSFSWALFDPSTGKLLCVASGCSFGTLETNERLRLLYRDEWVPLPDEENLRMVTDDGRDVVLEFIQVTDLHKALLPLMDRLVERIVFHVDSEEQASFARSFQAEKVDQNVLICWGSRDSYVGVPLPESSREVRVTAGNALETRVLTTYHATKQNLLSVKAGGVYLVTGGLGPLGVALAKSLVEKGAERVYLLGRTERDVKLPVKCSVLLCDVADSDALRLVLEPYLPHLNGVFHCAGALRDATLQNLTSDQFEAVRRPKVTGAENLLKLVTSCADLDFVVLFSSITAGFGAAGQSNYAAANGGLDDLAQRHQEEGFSVLSIRWGPWHGEGMAAQSQDRWERLGFFPLDPQLALDALFSISRSEALPYVLTIADLDRNRLEENASPLFRTYVQAKQDAKSSRSAPADVDDIIRSAANGVGVDLPSMSTPWREAGMDSLSMIEFRNFLSHRLRESPVDLYDTVLFDFSTPESLAEYLVSQLENETWSLDAVQPAKVVRESGSDDALAVTGVACRLPGGITSPDEFWDALVKKEDLLGSIPLARFDSAVFCSPNPAKGKSYISKGGFLCSAEWFDRQRFGCSEQEVRAMDPQQRVALQVAYEALQSAGLLEDKSKTVGVFVGVMTNDWGSMVQHDLDEATAQSAAGHIPCILANRISYIFGLKGPSMSIDTACSSSLVALHAASAALRVGDCDAALVLGVNLMLSPAMYVEECAARMLSPNGRCATFSEAADGYARSEGCVAIVVEPLASGTPELGRILSTAVNQDGRSANLTSPNGKAQEEVIKVALRRAKLTPEDITFVETHGTGTPLGDPIEVRAIASVFHSRKQPLYLSASKSIVGHTEAAAGLTSVLKALLSLERGVITPNLHYEEGKINPKVADAMLPSMVIPEASFELNGTRVAGVSSFGFGGTNAHVIVAGSRKGERTLFGLRHDQQNLERFPWTPPHPCALSLDLDHFNGDLEPTSGWYCTRVDSIQDVVSILRTIDAVESATSTLLFVTSRECNNKSFSAGVCGFLRGVRLERPWQRVCLAITETGEIPAMFPQGELEAHFFPTSVILVPRLSAFSKDLAPYSLSWPQRKERNEPVILTGASGGIGMHVAEFLLDEMCFQRVVCLSRSGQVAPALQGRVETYACDVSQIEQVRHVAALVGQPALLVIHAAGVLRESPAKDYSEDWFQQHWDVKVSAAHNLHDCFAPKGFVSFSSTSGFLGMKNGAAYAAANAALDSVTESFRASGTNAVSIQWDIWAEAGMAHERNMASSDRGLSNHLALQLFAGVLHNLEHLPASVVLASADWRRVWNTTKNPLLAKFAEPSSAPRHLPTKDTTMPRYDVVLPSSLRFSDLLAWLLEFSQKFISAKEDEEGAPLLSHDTSWQEVGFDSLSMTDMIAGVNNVFGLSHSEDLAFSDTAMFDHPTPAAFATFLEEELAERQVSLVPPLVESPEKAVELPTPTKHGRDVAVVGMALRFPGASDNVNVESFWQLLNSGKDALQTLRESRFPHLKRNKQVYVEKAGLLHPDLLADAVHGSHLLADKRFKLSNAELASIDPHQKLALQVAAEALEQGQNGGVNMEKVGVFVGAQNPEFTCTQQDKVNTFTATGTALSIIANRISYCFDLTGPSMTIDTACSSSLVALDTAIKALLAGDCTAALVLSVDLMLSSHRFETTCAAKMLSPNSRCATFSDQADGYVRGEGCGALLISLDAALADDAPAWAIIKSVCINQDGQSANLTSPKGPAQQACVRSALERAGISDTLDKIAFIEAHGTGTSLGDPQELEALANVFKTRKTPLPIGAVKSCIGHLEAAAGVAGLIKTVLSLAHRQLPPNLHFEKENPRIARLSHKCKFVFPTKSAIPLVSTQSEDVLFAGVSSFGFGGTNSHAVLASVAPDRVAKMRKVSFRPVLGSKRPEPFSVRATSPGKEWVLTVSSSALETVRSHRVGKVEVIPGTTYIEMLEPILAELFPHAAASLAYTLDDLEFFNMLLIQPNAIVVDVLVRAEKASGNGLSLNILSTDGAIHYARMTANVNQRVPDLDLTLEEAKNLCVTSLVAGEELYKTTGNEYQGPFRGLVSAWASTDSNTLLGKVQVDLSLPALEQPTVWLDVASHVGIAMLSESDRMRPIYAEKAGSYFSACRKAKAKGTDQFLWSVLRRKDVNTFDMYILGLSGNLLAKVSSFSFGFFRQQKREELAPVFFVDEYVPLAVPPLRLNEQAARDVLVLDTPSVEQLHDRVLRVLRNSRRPRRLQIIARDPSQIGYARTLRSEQPDLHVQTLWSSPSFAEFNAEEADPLRDILEDEICCDASLGKVCPRIRRANFSTSLMAPRLIRDVAGGVFLVTGGLGELGRAVANMLVSQGADYVLLISRRPGTQVPLPERCEHVCCDVSDVQSLRDALESYQTKVRGIFHCAGVLEDSTIDNMRQASFEVLHRPKASGLQALLALDLPQLRFCIAFSSLSGGIGLAGQANYAAANVAMDWVAQNVSKVPVCSIRWGPWGSNGMAASDKLSSRWRRLGLEPFEPAQAIKFMLSLPAEIPKVVTICDFSSPTFLSHFNQRSYFAELSPLNRGTVESSNERTEGTDWLALVLQLAADVNPDPDVQIDEATPWRDAGLDSLSMVELRNLVQTRTGLDLRPTILFDFPTPKSLAAYLAEVLDVEPSSSSSFSPSSASSKPGNLLGVGAVKVNLTDATSVQEDREAPIVVSGAACRLPGNVSSPEDFWNLLCNGRDVFSDVPLNRFDASRLYEDSVGEPGKIYTMRGAFLRDVDLFDNTFFGISDQEARAMDPQQRVALEVAFEALSRAGIANKADPKSCITENVGVFVGAMTNDWATLLARGQVPSKVSSFTATGHANSVLANRISYTLGLKGPSMAVDTACSSSLVALDLACHAITRGDCEAAVVLGVNLILAEDLYVEECAARMLSKDGRCFTFSSKANGYARGEGCVGIVIERGSLYSPRPHANAPLGVICSTSVNQDGRSANLTSPNGLSQERVVQKALEKAEITVDDVSFIETHGTGTALGDPMEVGALASVFKHRHADSPLVLGAVKSLVGHTEGAAGLTGVLKALLCIKERVVPGNFSLPSSADLSLEVQNVATSSMHFPLRGELAKLPLRKTYAGVSSFGFGGTNAHVVLSSWDAALSSEQSTCQVEVKWNRKRFAWTKAVHFLESAKLHAATYKFELFGLDAHAVMQAHTVLDFALHRLTENQKTCSSGVIVLQDVKTGDLWGSSSEDRQESTSEVPLRFDVTQSSSAIVYAGDNKIKAWEATLLPVESWKENEQGGLSGNVAFGFEASLDPQSWLQSAMEQHGLDQLDKFAETLVLKNGEQLEVKFKPFQTSNSFVVNPALLGEAFQALAILSGAYQEPISNVVSLEKIRQLYFRRPSHHVDTLSLSARIQLESMSIRLEDEASGFLLEMVGVEFSGCNSRFGENSMLRKRWVPSSTFPLVAPSDPLRFELNSLFGKQTATLNVARDDKLQRYCGRAIAHALANAKRDRLVPPKRHLAVLLSRWEREYAKFLEIEPVERCAEDGVEFDYFDLVKDQLFELISGQVNAVDVLFKDPALTTRLYSESGPSLPCNLAIANGVEQAVQYAMKDSPGRVIRILELGAGTGGTTLHVLPKLATLSDQVLVEYYFTDISEYFMRAAQTKLREFLPLLKFHLLDIEGDLVSQGFEAGCMDIVVASNIIHATQDLSVTLGNVKHLLASGGLFFLNEATFSTAFLDSTFAFTEGWWRFLEQDRFRDNEDGPLLLPETWDTVLGKCGFTRTLVRHRAAQGQVVLVSQVDATFIAKTSNAWSGSSGEDWAAIVSETLLASNKGGLPDGVMFHVARDDENVKVDKEVLEAARRFVSNPIATLLVFVTQASCFPSHGAVAGLASALRKEYTRRHFLVVDIAECVDPKRAAQLVLEETKRCTHAGASMQVRFDNTLARFEARLYPGMPCKQQQQQPSLRQNGTYLITGGLGGLGLLTAKVLLEQGAKTLVLVSRSGKLRAGLKASRREEELHKQIINWPGAQVIQAACDVSNYTHLERLVQGLSKAYPPIVGIIHSAGTVRDALFMNQTWGDHFDPVYGAKARSALYLHELSEKYKLALDMFVMYSSAASMFGSKGQSNHAAANGVLDALADYRRARGLAAVSINWGGWTGIGAAVDKAGAAESIRSRGMGLISLEQGKQYILQALADGSQPNFGVVPIHWPSFLRFEVDTSYLTTFLASSGQLKQQSQSQGQGQDKLAKSQPKRSEQESDVSSGPSWSKENVLVELEAILDTCGVSSVSDTFEEQGLDSLTSIEVIGLVRDKFGVKLTPTFFLDFPTGEQLAEYLCNSLSVSPSPGPSLGDDEVPSAVITRGNKETGEFYSPWIEPLFKPSLRLFCFAYAGGHPNVFQGWTRYLPASVQICPISMPGYGRQTDTRFWNSIPELAKSIAGGLPRDLPFAFAGSCLGAILSFEVTRALVSEGDATLPFHLFMIACCAPQDYSQALRLLYSNRLKENPYFVPSDETMAVERFSDLSEEERNHTVQDLRNLGFFKDDETLDNLRQNQVYFEHVMSQLAGQMQLAERYKYTDTVRLEGLVGITSISGAQDETIPQDWPANWQGHSLEDSFEYISIPDGGHYLVQTHPEEVCGIVNRVLGKLQKEKL